MKGTHSIRAICNEICNEIYNEHPIPIFNCVQMKLKYYAYMVFCERFILSLSASVDLYFLEYLIIDLGYKVHDLYTLGKIVNRRRNFNRINIMNRIVCYVLESMEYSYEEIYTKLLSQVQIWNPLCDFLFDLYADYIFYDYELLVRCSKDYRYCTRATIKFQNLLSKRKSQFDVFKTSAL